MMERATTSGLMAFVIFLLWDMDSLNPALFAASVAFLLQVAFQKLFS